MKVLINLLHCNGVVRNDFSISAISAVFDGIGVWLHELLMFLLSFDIISVFIALLKKSAD